MEIILIFVKWLFIFVCIALSIKAIDYIKNKRK